MSIPSSFSGTVHHHPAARIARRFPFHRRLVMHITLLIAVALLPAAAVVARVGRVGIAVSAATLIAGVLLIVRSMLRASAVDVPTDAEPEAEAEQAMAAAGETILVVEDEPSVREFVQRTLRRRGYIVHAMPDPPHAIAFAESHTGRIDAVVTDVSMPIMSGPVMSERVLAAHPEAGVVFISGYICDGVAADGLTGTGRRFLAKPFITDTLVASIEAVIIDRQGSRDAEPVSASEPRWAA
jgi:CheY-like chemotaxis protein